MVGVDTAGSGTTFDRAAPPPELDRVYDGEDTAALTDRDGFSFSFLKIKLPVSDLVSSSAIGPLVTAESIKTSRPINTTTKERHPGILPDDARYAAVMGYEMRYRKRHSTGLKTRMSNLRNRREASPRALLEAEGIPEVVFTKFSTIGNPEMRLITMRYPARESRRMEAAYGRVAMIACLLMMLFVFL